MATGNEPTTVLATPNIALVKYWGRRDSRLNLPTNSSISITLGEGLSTRTSVLLTNRIRNDTLYINGERHRLGTAKDEKFFYIGRVLDELKRMDGTKKRMLVVTENNYPTGAGLASSAAGAAALIHAASEALGLNLDAKEMSRVARLVSGSGCRSLFGGFAIWHMGKEADGRDSYAEQLYAPEHWPDIVDIVAIVDRGRKPVSTSEGHERTRASSNLYKYRADHAEERSMRLMDALKHRDFESMAHITMRDSNSMHACCLDSYPPINYLNDDSVRIMRAVHMLNDAHGEVVAAYTFDAGPNAHVITTRRNAERVMAALKDSLGKRAELMLLGQGSGPRILGAKESLIDMERLRPVAHE